MGNSKGKIKYVSIIILAVIITAGLVATVFICSRGKSTELRELEAKAAALCEEAGLEDVNAKVTGPTAFSEYKCYTLTVTGNGTEKIGYPKLIELMNTVDDYEVSFKGSVLQSRFIVDGARFKYFSFCGYLFRDEEKVYPTDSNTSLTFVNGYPYEGMSEDLINATDLGEADEVVYCKDFSALRADRRYKTYNWYNSNGRKKATATVYYKNGEGYVSSFSLIEYNSEAMKEAGRKLREEKKSSKTDQYNTKDYSDPDDFYEDYYDDFYDYEDAEDYYYDNCD